jgi:hypothetical protein
MNVEQCACCSGSRAVFQCISCTAQPQMFQTTAKQLMYAYFNNVLCIFYYFVQWPKNAQLFHKLSHCYMFRHYRVILRELVINTLPSYTSISNSAVGNTISYKMFHIGFMKVLILLSYWFWCWSILASFVWFYIFLKPNGCIQFQ